MVYLLRLYLYIQSVIFFFYGILQEWMGGGGIHWQKWVIYNFFYLQCIQIPLGNIRLYLIVLSPYPCVFCDTLVTLLDKLVIQINQKQTIQSTRMITFKEKVITKTFKTSFIKVTGCLSLCMYRRILLTAEPISFSFTV